MNNFALTTALSCSLVSAAAYAQTPYTPPYTAPDPAAPTVGSLGAEAFGDVGQIVIMNDFDLSFGWASTKRPFLNDAGGDAGSEDESSSNITIAPALTFFVAQNLGVGGFLVFQHQSFDQSKTEMVKASSTLLRLGPEVSYNVRFGPALSLFPRVSLGYASLSTSVEETPQGGDKYEESGHGFSLSFFVPVLFHPMPHFFLGFGPAATFDLSSSVTRKSNGVEADGKRGPKTTIFGLNFVLGGWL